MGIFRHFTYISVSRDCFNEKLKDGRMLWVNKFRISLSPLIRPKTGVSANNNCNWPITIVIRRLLL